MSDDDGVTRLPVKNKRDDDGKLFLVPAPVKSCSHFRGAFEIDKVADKCFCRDCGAEVSPMFVLERLMQKESIWMKSSDRYLDELKRLAERSSTKCQHCHKMTKISRN